ncbi:MAG: hypothetical protein QGI36_06275, partial [Candidatus Thalassarchaeaceae archaeon]|nr:hypothetical protein [Candidatus Thalassarchaeaceae archaeon]
MSPEPKEGESAKFADGTSEAGDKQVLGKQLWRIFPYIKPYWKRFALGITSNMGARICDLLPFVAMGLAVDYYQSGNLTGPSFLTDVISNNPELGYGVLIFSCF